VKKDSWPWLIILPLLSCVGLLLPSECDSVRGDDSAAPSDSCRVAHAQWIQVRNDVAMRHYFESMDTICWVIDSIYHIPLNEYELVHANPRILDTLKQQDYYNSRAAGRFIYDQRQCIVLHRGDSIRVPSAQLLDSIRSVLNSVTIDVNVPEFMLRIYVGDSVVHTCPVRVGKNERKYLALAGHEVDLRTPIGEGSIVRIERSPIYINPVDGHRYQLTRRDDGVYTKLPRIPFLEPEIDGRRMGALMHPTTNIRTLGKAVSNGCVGMSEADAWVVYYYAPLGAKVRFRYDLHVDLPGGGLRRLDDVYSRE